MQNFLVSKKKKKKPTDFIHTWFNNKALLSLFSFCCAASVVPNNAVTVRFLAKMLTSSASLICNYSTFLDFA